MLPAPRRGGGAAGLCPAAGPLPGLARQRARSSQRSLCVAAKAASFNSLAHWASASLFPPLAALGSAPGVSAPTFLLPMSNRRNAGGGALAQGRRETLGYAGGGGVWRPRGAFGPPGPAKPKSPGRGLGIFRARSAPPPPPRGGWGATGGKKGSSRPSWRPKPTARGLQPLVAEKTTMVSSMQPDSVIP